MITVNSWGRKDTFSSLDQVIYKTRSSNKYDLENLDVSQIDDLSSVFDSSLYNGDLSKWDVSNCQNFKSMFSFSEFNNDSLKDWNISNAKTLRFMFYGAKFDNVLSNYNFNFNFNDIIILNVLGYLYSLRL